MLTGSDHLSSFNSTLSLNQEKKKREVYFGDSDAKESACNAGDPGSILGSGRFPGEVNGYPLQYSSLENSMDRGA